MSTLQVHEIFSSIQGESTRAGLPCSFVRLTGCNLRCRWCDTTYAYEGGEGMTVREVVERVAGLGVALVEVTGGEPLLQPATVELLAALRDERFEVMLETNGSLDVSVVPEGVFRVIDLKCPGSGMHKRMLMSNLDVLRPTDEMKFVLADRADYEWARDLVRNDGRLTQTAAIHFVPVCRDDGSGLRPAELAGWMLADRVEARLSLQLHKVIWGWETRR